MQCLLVKTGEFCPSPPPLQRDGLWALENQVGAMGTAGTCGSQASPFMIGAGAADPAMGLLRETPTRPRVPG